MSGNVPVGYHAVGDLLQDGLDTLAVGNFLQDSKVGYTSPVVARVQ